jgi:hypothetical protein
LTNQSVVDAIGVNVWKIVPMKWRDWWIESLIEKNVGVFGAGAVTIINPSPYFLDGSGPRDEFLAMQVNLLLPNIIDVLNKHLNPSVLCPWGCTAYAHECGSIPFDAVLQSFLSPVVVPLTQHGSKSLANCLSARRDYLSDIHDLQLLNPEIEIWPTVAFTEGTGLVVLTCSRHDKGTRMSYFHLPRLIHSVPSSSSDQLAHAIIHNRTIKPMKAKMYNTSYELNKQVGSFNGIDTCIVGSHGNFHFHSPLLAESESRSIAFRTDIRGLVNQLVNEKQIDPETAENMRNLAVAKHGEPGDERRKLFRDTAVQGATYMTYVDAIKLQKDLSTTGEITIWTVRQNSNGEVEQATIVFVPSWPRRIVWVHNVDSHGSSLNAVPNMVSPSSRGVTQVSPLGKDARLVWYLSVLSCNVPEVWDCLSSSNLSEKGWTGYFLSFLSGCVFSSRSRTVAKNDVFKNAKRWRPHEVLNNIANSFDTAIVRASIGLGGYKPGHICRAMRSALELDLACVAYDGSTDVMDTALPLLCSSVRIFIITDSRDEFEFVTLPNIIRSDDGCHFELVFVGATDVDCQVHNDCVAYVCHGGPLNGWWRVSQMDRIGPVPVPLQTEMRPWDSWTSAAYIQRSSTNSKKLRNEFLHYIGGQSHVTCRRHEDIPLVIGEATADKCPCGGKMYLRCPKHGCRAYMCKSCFAKILPTETMSVNPVEDTAGIAPAATAPNGDVNDDDDDDEQDFDAHNFDWADIPDAGGDGNVEVGNGLGIIGESNVDEDLIVGNNEEEGHVGMDKSGMDPVSDLHTGFESELFDSDLFPEDGPPHEVGASTNHEGVVPTTGASHTLPPNVSHSPHSIFMGNTVLLNGVGSLLVRPNYKRHSSRKQQQFLHSLASSSGHTVPLVYPEAMLFPSIFSFDIESDSSSIIGAMPCSLLSQNKNHKEHGIASIADHVRTRLQAGSSSSATDPRYLNWSYDCLVNASIAGSDTRLILNRGFAPSSSSTGLQLRNEKDTFFSDSIDNRSMVNKLTAAQQYVPTNVFITITANQRLTAGLSHIKRWIDSDGPGENFPGYSMLSANEQQNVRRAIHNSAASLMQRNWLQVRKLLMDYLRNSPEKAAGTIDCMFWRDEYQENEGNLPHVHALLRVLYDKDNPFEVEEFNNRIRGFTGDLVRVDEIEPYIAEGLLQDYSGWFEVMDLAETILTHRSERNLKRTGPGKNDLKPRDQNNYYISPDPMSYATKKIDPNHTTNAVSILVECQLATAPPAEDPRALVDCHPLLQCERHFPPLRRHGGSMSPVIPRMFLGTLSMQNAQKCSGYTVNRYVTKYVTKTDKNTLVLFNVNVHDSSDIQMHTTFLHNTKISSSAKNERLKQQRMRNGNHPSGRIITRHEMLQLVLGDPQVYTDMVFVNVSTAPLAERVGVEITPQVNRRPDDNAINLAAYRQQCGNDSVAFIIHPDQARRMIAGMPPWRQFTASQLVLINDTFFSGVSMDQVTVFGVRPPELRVLIRTIGNYFRWFWRSKKSMATDPEKLSERLDGNVSKCLWIDGMGHHVLLRSQSIKEVESFIQSAQSPPNGSPLSTMLSLFQEIFEFNNRFGFTNKDGNNIASIPLSLDRIRWDEMQASFIDFTHHSEAMLPVPVFSNIKPSNASRFLFHLLLSLGEYDTEMDLLVHSTSQQAFIGAKLISDDISSIEDSVVKLTRRYIVEQLSFYPISTRAFDHYLETASRVLKESIIHDRIPLDEAPACLYTKLQAECKDREKKIVDVMKTNAITAAYSEHQPFSNQASGFPTLDEFISGNVDWDGTIDKTSQQSQESYDEQCIARRTIANSMKDYADPSRKTLSKSVIVAGSPGAGKTNVLQYSVLFGVTLHLFVLPLSVMAERALAIGGIHFAKLFKFKQTMASAQRLAEKAIIEIMKRPDSLVLLLLIDVIACDELGMLMGYLVHHYIHRVLF